MPCLGRRRKCAQIAYAAQITEARQWPVDVVRQNKEDVCLNAAQLSLLSQSALLDIAASIDFQ
jgi:hypothetical protein